MSTTFCIQLYTILFILWRYNNLALKGLTLSERIARRPAACIAAINYETDYVETNTVDTSHGPLRDGKGGRGRKGLCYLPVTSDRWGSQSMEGGARCILLVYELRRTRSPVQRAFLGNLFSDMIRIVKYRYLFAGSELQFMTLKNSNGTNHSTFIACK